jgi:hypothetical protein
MTESEKGTAVCLGATPLWRSSNLLHREGLRGKIQNSNEQTDANDNFRVRSSSWTGPAETFPRASGKENKIRSSKVLQTTIFEHDQSLARGEAKLGL